MEIRDFIIKVYPLKDMIFRSAKVITMNQEDAEDITQEVFVKLWDNREQLNHIDNVKGYAFTLTRNLCFDQTRRMNNYKKRVLPGLADNSFVNPDFSSGNEDLLNNLIKVIEQLPAKQRWVFTLKTLEGMSYEEIAVITEMSIDNIRMHVSRARNEIRKQFKTVAYGQ